MTHRVEEMHQAATAGDLSAIERLAQETPELVNDSDANGLTPLLLAAAHGHSDAAVALLGLGASPNAKNARGQAALHYAAYRGDGALVQALLAAEADPLTGDLSGTTAMHYAGIGGDIGVIDALAAAGIDPEVKNIYRERPAHRAAQAGSLPALQHLQELGADLHAVDALGLTLAHKAAIGNASGVLAWLAERGLRLDERDLAGDTPLHGAASVGRAEGVRALLDMGQSPALVDHDRATPLHKAAEAGSEECVETLLRHGADPVARDALGRTPLHWAAIRGHIPLLEPLCIDGASEPDDWFGCTPAQLAAYYGRTAAAKRLGIPAGEGGDPRSMDLESGQATVWYLGNSGWAVRTSERLLVFDYVPAGPRSDESSLLNGAVCPEDLSNLPVTVFVTHSHNDHFSAEILGWRDSAPDLTIVAGGTWCDAPGVVAIEGRSRLSLDGIEIHTIPSTDSGVAFLVEVDGLRLYHAGDHVSRVLPLEPAFSEEIDRLTSLSDKVDIAFLPVFGCGFPSRDGVLEGARYTMDRLRPATVFPMHVGWTSTFYREFVERAAQWETGADVVAPDVPGDRFLYKDGRIQRLLA